MSEQERVFTPLAVIQMLFFILVVPFLPLLISRHWDWWEAWIYALVSILGFIVSRALARRRHPDLLRERARFLRHADAKSWDRLLAPLTGLGGGLIPILAGLDELFSLSPAFSLAVKIISLFFFLGGYLLASYALIENRFFSGMVRLQFDRGHQVVSSGPYAWIRHPGYAGALLSYWFTPSLLDSYWAYIPVLFMTVVLVVRTRLEDATLQQELEGYAEYAGRVRYRLFPGLW